MSFSPKISFPVSVPGDAPRLQTFSTCFHATEQLFWAQPAPSCLYLRGWDENYLQPPASYFWSSPCTCFIVLLWLGGYFQLQRTSQTPEPHAWVGTGGITNGCRATLPLRKNLLTEVKAILHSAFTEGIISVWILLVQRRLSDVGRFWFHNFSVP